MATIDYKQKIKDYMNSSEVDTLYKSMLNNLFPELAESDDEKIRKALIKGINDISGTSNDISFWGGISTNDAIAWLEKIGEMGTNGNNREIPNSAWSEEDEENMMMIEDRLSDYLDYIREDTSLTKLNKNSMKEEIIEYVNWLKSLKERVQPKQEWSEEDYNEIETIACHLDNIDNEGMAEALRNIRDKYYHIIPQSTWKPSESDIRILEQVIDGTANPINYHTTLHAILEKLKKLMEE